MRGLFLEDLSLCLVGLQFCLLLYYCGRLCLELPLFLLCGVFKYRAFTSIVARMQFDGMIVFSSRRIMCPLSLM